MKKLLSVILLSFLIFQACKTKTVRPLTIVGPTTPLTFTQIPLTDPEPVGPNRGAEDWANNRVVPLPLSTSPDISVDNYTRFCWLQLQDYTTSAYTFTAFDNAIHFAIDNGKRFNFRVFAMYPGQSSGVCGNTVGGFPISYPKSVHDAMQAEPTLKDAVDGSAFGLSSWCPNWNSTSFRTAWNNLQDAIIAHLYNNVYKGVKLYDAVGYVDIGTFGYTGEWTGLNATTNTGFVPANLIATAATQIQFISDFVTKWPNKQLSICIGAVIGDATFGGGVSDGAAPPEVGYYVFQTAANNIGRIGIRRDCLGQTNTFIPFLLENNSTVYNGLHFNTAIMNIYQVAPFNGEPCSCCTNPASGGGPTAGVPYFDLPRQVTFYHLSGFGNGNFSFIAADQAASQDSIRQASKNAGYRLGITGGAMTTTLTTNGAFSISLDWRNFGVAPVYRHYKPTYQLRNGSNVVWTGVGTFDPHLLLPSSSSTTVSNDFVATSVPAGIYSLYMIMNDTATYNVPLTLSITGVGTDKAYLLRNNITVTAASGVVANAGSNQTITLPTSTVTVSGAGSTGTITSYLWTRVSGPNTPTIATPSSVTTNISGLIAGTYVFQLSVNGGASTSQVTITVNPAAAPIANAGTNQTITLPTNSVTLSGSGSTGTITSYAWTQISGPNTASITTPTSVGTTVTGLIQGMYVFRLSINGGVSTSTVSVTVLPVSTTISIFTVEAPTQSTPYNDNQASVGIELGVKFRSTIDGYVTGVKFYKLSGMTGSHIGELYSNVGTRLAQATFTGESTSGWQTVLFSTPVLITANTTYTAAMFSASGYYLADANYFQNSGLTNGSLTALQSGVDGLNGTYNYGSAPLYPTLTFGGGTNYWTDVIFSLLPVANAGANQAITLPTNSVTLSGSGSTGSITSYAWSQVSGPSTATISTPTNVSTTVSALIQGTYVFKLSLNGGASTSNVTITVNAAAVANAGADQTITAPLATISLNGSSSTGTITSYSWTRVSGPNTPTITTPTTVSTTVTGLIAGTYVFQLSINGGTSTDQITITVNPAPVANAGIDQTITLPTNSASLSASSSTGTISTYAWSQVSGPNTAGITTPTTVSTTVTGLIAGTYVFQISLNSGVSTDQVTIIVNPVPTPTANAGIDQTITLPTNSVTLNGNGSTGTITSYSWTRVSGPNIPTITTPTTVSTTVTGLIAGTYVFQLSLNGGTATDQIIITVNSAIIANAGSNQTITLPTSSVSLSAAASTGVITSYAWTRVSGPNTPTITTPTAVSTTVTGLIAGTYIFQISLNSSASTSQVTVIVNPVPPPVANAGSDQIITLPTSTVSVSGSGSTGTITSYLWSQVSGPNTASITTPTTSSTTITGLIAGPYVFKLTLNGGTASSTVNITVNPAIVANAGVDQTITLPTSTVTLTGSSSTGTITNYLWTRVSGPNIPTITSPTSVTTTITGLIAGTYVFQLSLNAGVSTDQVTITVAAAPVANAGIDQTITLPTNSATVNASSSTGTITTYLWTRVSGPNTPTITTPTTVSTTITGLIQGTYVFQVSLNGGISTDQIVITVNPVPLPVANAGVDQTITLPTSSVSLDGSGSTGSISSYAWTQVSGPNTGTITTPTTVTTTVTGLIQGTYVFQLSLNGGTATDQIVVTVNAAAVANAGANQTISAPTTSATLSGSGSTGVISTYAWTQISGPNTATITTPSAVGTTVTGLIAGTYIFQLSINDGASTSQVTIIVNPVPPPVANAGIDQTITLPTSSVTLNASGSSGVITSYLWSQVSGPNTASITSATSSSTGVTGLIAGTYIFQLTLNGGTSTDQVSIIVNPAPTANAGSDQTITLPISSVTLSGSGSIGIITSYTWTQISGPNTATITTPTSVGTTVTGLIAGTYVFQLSINSGASTDQVSIIVNPAPVANAGIDQTITLPTSSVTVSASSSTGTITSYAWTRVSGPNTPTITTPTTVSTTITGLTSGTYIFQVSLNGGASTDQVTITVNPVPAPVANAGVDQTITLPTNSVSLSASSSTGTISSYTWTQISGPNTASITTPTSVGTTVTGLIAGTYVFQVSLNAGVSTDRVTITVNTAIVANAGIDQTITLPTSSTSLDGGASTGVITAYLWTQTSGPNTATIVTPTNVSTSITGLIQGTYVFQLSVNAGTSTDPVTITVNAAAAVVANAGPDQTITLPTSSVTLNGSGSTGSISSYAWTQVSGPNTASITAPTSVTTNATGLIAGRYIFKLSLNGGTATDQIIITVNPVPAVANAGPDQTITLPTNSVTLSAAASTGTITSYFWSKISGPTGGTISTPFSSTTSVTGLTAGTYVFRISLNRGASTDLVTIIVNAAPTANAGSNQTITLPTSTTTLNGSGSTGTITSYLWTKVSGPTGGTITSPTSVSTGITALIQGTYVFRLSINGGVSTSNVTVTVNPAIIANVGADQTITLPTSSVTLSGSGSTGVITSYLWTRVSGPNTPTITTPATVGTTVTGLITGTYIFQLSLNGGVSTDQVTITVNAASNAVANAGANQTVVLPTSSVTLDGSGSTGTITTYLWTRVSGPNTPTITTPATVGTTVTGLIAGTYVFRMTVNSSSTSNVTITVIPIPSTINIFTTQTPPNTTYTDNTPLELGVKFRSTVVGYITGVRFYKTTLNVGIHTAELYDRSRNRLAQKVFTGESSSGWQTATFTTPVGITANTTYTAAYFSASGFYYADNFTFNTAITNSFLTALDNNTDGPNGVSQYSSVPIFPSSGFKNSNYWVDVVFQPNVAPTAVITGLGAISSPTSNVTLSGTSSASALGSIAGYLWTNISGPNTPTIVTSTSSTTNITGLITGVYVFQLRVTDNLGAVTTAQKTVTVMP